MIIIGHLAEGEEEVITEEAREVTIEEVTEEIEEGSTEEETGLIQPGEPDSPEEETKITLKDPKLHLKPIKDMREKKEEEAADQLKEEEGPSMRTHGSGNGGTEKGPSSSKLRLPLKQRSLNFQRPRSPSQTEMILTNQ